MAEYEIHLSKARKARGLPCFGVFEVIESAANSEPHIHDLYFHGIASYHTEAEAKAAVTKLEAEQA